MEKACKRMKKLGEKSRMLLAIKHERRKENNNQEENRKCEEWVGKKWKELIKETKES